MGTLDRNSSKREMGMPFEGFLAYLRRQGFIIGVDHHIRLQELLNRLGPGCQPADLKYLLCPLFATSEKQQQQFYRAFDSYFKCFDVKTDIIKAGKPATKVAHKTTDIESSQESVVTRKWPYILAAALLLLMVAMLSYWVYQPKTMVESLKTTVVDSPGTSPGVSKKTTAAGKESKAGTEPKPTKSTLETGEGKPDSTKRTKIDTSQSVKPEDREVPIIKPDTSKKSSAPSFDEVRKWAEKIDQLNQLNNLNKSKYEPTFYQRYWYVFRWVGFLGTFIIFLFIEIYKYIQRRLILQQKRGKKPPYVWPILVENPELGIVKNYQFYEAARFLRMRLKSDIRQIDVPKSISKTTKKAGFPSLEYTTLTQPPEYLILIDLPAYRDHHAHLFDSIAKALEKEGLFVARYFYEKDPRVCFKEPDGKRFYLSDLKTRYSDHRLIIFGNGEEFLDPISGVLDNWTSLFQVWRERAILTPEQPKYWSLREVALAHEFIVLPASLEGLAALVDHFKLSLESDLKTWKKTDLQNIGTPTSEYNIDELKAYLGEDAFQWLCSCAVYPELHWDLTLYLGSLPCMPENLINEENLLRLIRLPWFRTGSMPDELRWVLIRELDSLKSRVIRTSIIELLEKNPPPKESVAFDTYRLQLVVQRWMLSRKSRKQRKEMLKKLRTATEKETTQDYTILRFLESSSKSPLNLVLPKRFRRVFYKKGVPLFGFRTGIRVVLTVLIAAALFIFLKEPHIPNIEIISKFPEMVPLKGGIYQMGAARTDRNSSPSERPQHEVNITSFAIGKFEVTNAEFVQFLNEKGNQEEGGGQWLLIDPVLTKIKFTFPGIFVVEKGYENYPVVGVSWYGANAYCRWLKERTGILFRLPTEAEWEFACRGGTKTEYSFGEDITNHEKYGWFRSNSGYGPHEVGQKLPNKFGLYDMHGNMWEWCLDGWSKNYDNTPRSGHAVRLKGYKLRVVRGGSWWEPLKESRSANRHNFLPILEINQLVGFRVVASLKKGFIDEEVEKVLVIMQAYNVFKLALSENPISTLLAHFNKYSSIKKSETKDEIKELKEMPDNVKAVALKGIKVGKNEKGYWEADFGDEIIMVYIPAGKFTMGSDMGDDDEQPPHYVHLDGYWIGKYEVTVKQFRIFVKNYIYKTQSEDDGWSYALNENGTKWEKKTGVNWRNPGFKQDEDHPVVNVSWNYAVEYCKWFSKRTGLAFKLPSEAQWEKAARGIDERKYPWGNDSISGKKLNFQDKQILLKTKSTSAYKDIDDSYVYTAPVGSYPLGISPYGVLDMLGNVWEWCNDLYDRKYYYISPMKNPPGPKSRSDHVLRGGGWYYSDVSISCTDRNAAWPLYRSQDIGFRLCMDNDLIEPSEVGYINDDKFKSGIVEIEPGFEYIEETIDTKSGRFSVKMVRVDQSLYELRVLGRDLISDRALSLIEHQRKTNAVCVLNGGFRLSFIDHEPIGLLIINGKERNPLTKKYSGIFAVQNQKAFILNTSDYKIYGGYSYALQGHPIIIDKGRVSVSRQSQKLHSRSFVAIDRARRVILGTSTPVTLYDLAAYLSQKGGLDCTAALNLEGGGVEGMIIKFNKFHNEIGFTDTPVPNAIAVYSK